MIKEKLWTKNFYSVFVISFVISLVFYLLMVSMGAYAIEQFHVSTSTAGLITGIYILGSLLGRLLTGSRIASIGHKRVLMFGLIFFMLGISLYFAAVNVPILLIVRFINGIGSGITLTAVGTIVALIVPTSRRGEGIGYFNSSGILATAIGPFLGIFLSQYTSYKTIFIFCLVLGAISLIITLMIEVPVIAAPKKMQMTIGNRFRLSNFFEFSAIPISFVIMIMGFTYSCVLSFITFYAKEINLVQAASFYFLVYAFMIMISRPFTGRLVDLKGVNIVAYPSLLIYATGMFMLSQTHQDITLLFAAAFIGLGFGNFTSAAQTISIKYSSPQRMGVATSTYFIFLDLGFGIGPYLLGALVPVIGYRGLYGAMAVVILASIIIYHFVQGSKENSTKLFGAETIYEESI